MITIEDVIEQCAREAERYAGYDAKHIAKAIRALAAQYEGCIVAESEIVTHVHDGDSLDVIPLYRAKEPTK